MHPRLGKAKVRRGSLSTKVMFQEILLGWISIAETSDREKSLKYLRRKLLPSH